MTKIYNPADLTETIELNDLSDVTITSPDENDFIKCDLLGEWRDFNLFGTANTWAALNIFANGIYVDAGAGIKWGDAGSGASLVYNSVASNGDVNTTSVFSNNVDSGSTYTLVVANPGAGTAGLLVKSGIKVTAFSSAGFVKNDASGNFSGGNSVTIADTDLAVSSPITLTGSTIGFDFSTNNTWTGTNIFQDDVTFDGVGSDNIFYDRSVGSWVHTISTSSTVHFKITGTETSAPSPAPKYLDIDITRNWTGAAEIASAMSAKITDSRTLSSGLFDLSAIFAMEGDYSGFSSSVSHFPSVFKMFMGTPTGAYSDLFGTDYTVYTGVFPATFNIFNVGVNNSNQTIPIGVKYDSGTAVSVTVVGIDYRQQAACVNTSSGTSTVTTKGFFFRPAIPQTAPSLDSGADVTDLFGYDFRPTGSLATAFGSTGTIYGYHYKPNVTGDGATRYIIYNDQLEDDIVLHADNSGVTFGLGDDARIDYDGDNLIINPKVVGSGYIDAKGAVVREGLFQATQANAQTIVGSGSEVINFDEGTTGYIKDTIYYTHDATGTSSNITLKVAGQYRITYNISWDSDLANRCCMRAWLEQDGTPIQPSASYVYVRFNTYGRFGSNHATCFYDATADDVLTLAVDGQIAANAFGASQVDNDTIVNETWITIEKI